MGRARGFELVTRVGFAARGIMYVLIGWLALKGGRMEDGAGILSYLDSGGGRLVLAAMAPGFLFYGLWRAADAWFDSQGNGDDLKGLVVRGGGAVSALVHLGLAWFALDEALEGPGSEGGGRESSEAGARAALDLPGGWLMLVAAAVLLFGTGLFQIARAWTLGFMKNLKAAPSGHGWLCWLGRGGFLARGIIFAMMGLLLLRAGLQERSSAAGGPAEALSSLPSGLQAAVAGGLLLFGLFSFAEAKYRRIHADAVTRFG